MNVTRRSEPMEEVEMLSCEMMHKEKEKQKSGSVCLFTPLFTKFADGIDSMMEFWK